MNEVVAVFALLQRRRRMQLGVLAVLMCLGIVAELGAIGALIPFLAIMLAPEHAQAAGSARALELLTKSFPAADPKLAMTLLFILLTILAGALRIFVAWCTTRLSFAIGVDITAALFEKIVRRPYGEYKETNSGDIVGVVTKKSDDVVFGVIYPALVLVSAAAVSAAVSLLLIRVNPLMALSAFAVFGLFYSAVLAVTRTRLTRNSAAIAEGHVETVKMIQNALGGFRELTLHRLHSVFVAAYTASVAGLKRAQGDNVFLTTVPRYGLEMFAMTLVALLCYFITRNGGEVTAAIPLLGAFVMGAQRLLPSVQQIYWAIANIRGSQHSLAEVVEILREPGAPDAAEAPGEFHFSEALRLVDVRFAHGRTAVPILDGCSLEVRKGARLGLVGATGSGKSTLLDLMMGLLLAQEGHVEVDGQRVDEFNRAAFQQLVAHVPQSIFLIDGTIAQNIAFGEDQAAVDMARVIEAATAAQLDEFILALPEGYQTRVGERGALLSGGQCQRIGIARALYRRPALLMLDEATSALDDRTEQLVMQAMCAMEGMTIVMIAHRLKSLAFCDEVYEVRQGNVRRRGCSNNELGLEIEA